MGCKEGASAAHPPHLGELGTHSEIIQIQESYIEVWCQHPGGVVDTGCSGLERWLDVPGRGRCRLHQSFSGVSHT